MGRMESVPAPPHGRARLLERESELASLDALIDQAVAGSARLALVEGPAGIGKSRLVAEARRLGSEAGLRVLAARGGELEREFPYGVVRQLFEPVLVDPDERDRLLAGSAAGARAVFDPLEADAEAADDASFAALHGLYWLTVNLTGDGPLLLIADDLHWTDTPSLRFLAYLIRRLEGLPALVVGTMRPAEPGADQNLLSEIAGDPLTVEMHPTPLTEPAVAEVVGDRLGGDAEPAFVAACHTSTGGNPLLLHELLKAIQAEGVSPSGANASVVRELGPRAASRAVLLRLARLPQDSAAVARAAAVLGDGAELPAVAVLAGLDDAAAARATATLVQAELLRPDPPLGFVHPLVREAVYRDVPPGERELQHEHAARLLEESGASPERVAAHLLTIPARGEQWVVDTLVAAAQSALQKGAAESAVSYLTRALDEPPPADRRTRLLYELGMAEALTSAPAAARHLQEAYEALEDPVERGRLAPVLGRAVLFAGAPEAGAALAREAAAALPPEEEDLRLRLKAFELVTRLFGVEVPGYAERLGRYRAERSGHGPGARMMEAVAGLELTYACGPAEDSAQLALDALADGQLIDSDNGLLSIGATNVLVLADRDEAVGAWEAMREDAYRRGSLFSVSSMHLWRAFMLLQRGDLAGAEEDLRTAEEEFELYGYGGVANAYVAGFQAAVLRERGDLAGARAALDRVERPAQFADGTRFWLSSGLALLVAEGRAEEALEAADELARLYEELSPNPVYWHWRSYKAEALDRLGRTDEAVALAEEELKLSREWGAPATLGHTLRVLGRLKRANGLGDLEESVEVLDGTPARLELAKSLAALGTAVRHARQPSDAREPLRRALELADACDAAGLAEHARSELYATGARPRSEALSGVEALTPSERRVADLAAEGQTNRDIAQTLFVTPKTVEVHLSNAYRKLGIRSRRELPTALAA
jgi:DNA-binding CsgD family transcriptional regulator